MRFQGKRAVVTGASGGIGRACALALVPVACHEKGDDGRSTAQRKTAEKTDRDAKEGALKQKQDPKADLKKQEANLARLRQNAKTDRELGNRVGAWAAERDARKVEKQIEQDKQALASSEDER